MALALGIAFSLFTALIVIAGDTLIKIAADNAALTSPHMAFGIGLYGTSAVLWFFAMRHITLAQAAVAYSMLTLIALCVIGAMWFDEPIGTREVLGIGFALAAMICMSHLA